MEGGDIMDRGIILKRFRLNDSRPLVGKLSHQHLGVHKESPKAKKKLKNCRQKGQQG